MLEWIANLLAIWAATETSGKSPNLFKVNLLYFFANCYSIYYFCTTGQPAYLVLYCVFLALSIRGLFHALRRKRHPVSFPSLHPLIPLREV